MYIARLPMLIKFYRIVHYIIIFVIRTPSTRSYDSGGVTPISTILAARHSTVYFELQKRRKDDALPGPGQFCGRGDEIGQSWLENLEFWLQFRGINEERKVAALALLLKDKTAAWYQSLPADRKNTFSDLRALFAERYGRTRLAQWQQAGLVWTLKQQKQQSVDDFIAAVMNAARNAGLTDE